MFCLRMNLVMILVVNYFTYCSSADNNLQCGIADSECQKKFYQYAGRTFSRTGLPEIGLPVIDPFQLTNESISIDELLNMTLVKGVAEGIGNCIVTSYKTNVEQRSKEVGVLCDLITIRGHYLLDSSPSVNEAFGKNLHGDGNVTVEFKNWLFKFKYPFKIVRRNGDIYLKALFNQANYETSVERVTVDLDNLKFGDEDISEYVTNYVNENWEQGMETFGQPVNEKSANYYYKIYDIFYNNTPASKYISGDLSSYVEN